MRESKREVMMNTNGIATITTMGLSERLLQGTIARTLQQ